MKKFRIEATSDDNSFRVQLRNILGFWYSGFVYTDYFAIHYKTKAEALQAIENYKNRFTTVE